MIDCFYKNKTSQSFLASASSCDKMTQFFTGKMPAAAAATGALESHTLIQKLKTVFSLLFLAPVPSPQSSIPPFLSKLPVLHVSLHLPQFFTGKMPAAAATGVLESHTVIQIFEKYLFPVPCSCYLFPVPVPCLLFPSLC